jgi:hypothetical protein
MLTLAAQAYHKNSLIESGFFGASLPKQRKRDIFPVAPLRPRVFSIANMHKSLISPPFSPGQLDTIFQMIPALKIRAILQPKLSQRRAAGKIVHCGDKSH